MLGLFVHPLRVLPEDVVALGAGGVLQLEHGLRVEEVHLAVAAPLVLPALDQPATGGRAVGRVGDGVPLGDLRSDHVEADPA